MNLILEALRWLADPAHLAGADGVPARLGQHLFYSLLALGVAAVVAVPLGIYLGHTGRGRTVTVALAGALRAMPTLGLLTFLAIAANVSLSLTIVPATVVLALLSIPPLLAGIYSGIETIDPDVVDGARATGLTEGQIITQVELPLAAPVIFGGVRSALLQVIATATVSAYLGLGGLGRYILDGIGVRDYPKMLAGGLAVIALALAADLLLAGIQRISMTRGVRVAHGLTH